MITCPSLGKDCNTFYCPTKNSRYSINKYTNDKWARFLAFSKAGCIRYRTLISKVIPPPEGVNKRLCRNTSFLPRNKVQRNQYHYYYYFFLNFVPNAYIIIHILCTRTHVVQQCTLASSACRSVI